MSETNPLPSNLGSALPSNLSNLVQSYQDEKAYIQNMNSINSLTRAETLANELQNIPTESVIKFKLARQLAENIQTRLKAEQQLFSQAEDILRADIETVAGFFYSLMNIYSYQELLYPEKIKGIDPNPTNVLSQILHSVQIVGEFCLAKDTKDFNIMLDSKDLEPELIRETELTKEFKSIMDKVPIDDRKDILKIAYDDYEAEDNTIYTISWRKQSDTFFKVLRHFAKKYD